MKFAIKDPLFWAKVDRSAGPRACWPWMGYRNPNGYGNLSRKRVQPAPIIASRYVLYLLIGKMPENDALHSCDNPPCCNPRHLRDGTTRENIHDAINRGRFVPPPRLVGAAHPMSKLNAQKVAAIRRQLAAGERHRVIAQRFKVGRTTITAISSGRLWRAA